MRVLALWSPDWPLTAAGMTPDEPAVVLREGLVLAATAAARRHGVRAGMRRREAQTCCPQLEVVADDPDRDARMFAPVINAVVATVPAAELVRAGLIFIDVHGTSRALGTEAQLADRMTALVDEIIDWAPRCQAGVATGRFAAVLAARSANGCLVINDAHVVRMVSKQPVAALQFDPACDGNDPAARRRRRQVNDFVSMLQRLGVTTFGDLAALPRRDVIDRFGQIGQWAYLLATQPEDRGIVKRQLDPSLAVHTDLDPPAERVDTAAFAGRVLSDQLVTQLDDRQLRCQLVAVIAHTAHGERLERHWRTSEGFGVTSLTDRIRWQLDGWISGSAPEQRPTAGICRLTLVPLEVLEGGAQLSMFDEVTDVDERVTQTLARIQGMLGVDAVQIGVEAGGRDPSAWVTTVPWTATDPSSRSQAFLPWPGQLPPPAPATLLQPPAPIVVVDRQGNPVTVSGRGEISAAPFRVRTDQGHPIGVMAWAGPWPVDERWWDGAGRRRARMQMVLDDGAGWLVVCHGGRWLIEASYD